MNIVLKDIYESIQDKNIMLACSSGVDSMALLDMLLKLANYKKIIVVHVNHKIRIQSEQEEAYLLNYCQKHGLKLYIDHLPKHDESNFQEWARIKRYDFFKKIASLEQIDILLTAHHANDQAETVIMRLLRQSSLEGIAGIKKWALVGALKVYRPLINIPKQQLIEYVKKHQIKYFEDESNKSDDYLRNRIRKHIIPVFEQENPNFLEALLSFADKVNKLSEFVKEMVDKFIKAEVSFNDENNKISMAKDTFLACNEVIQIEVLFTLLKQYNLSKAIIDEIIKQIKTPKEPIIAKLTSDLLMVKEYGNIIFVKDFKELDFFLKIKEDGTYLLPNNQEIIIFKNICNYKAIKINICYNIQDLPIIVRSRQDGDRIKLKTGTKKVSDYLTDKKIPYLVRNQSLLLCDKNNDVIAILGLVSSVYIKDVKNIKGGNNGTS